MTQTGTTLNGTDASRVLSIDAMGGDNGPATVVAGLALFLKKKPGTQVILHGRAAELTPLLDRHGLTDKVTLRDATDVVTMHDKPSLVVRQGKATSMWSAIDAVRNGEAGVVVSCGNTGGLMAMSMLRLRKVDGVNRPAIACLWPSRNPQGFNVMLDAGADIRADQDDLLIYALMGTSYARNAFDLKRPRVGLLNVGTEEHKGRAELKVAHELIGSAATKGDFEYVGFVEGGDLPGDVCDVIVTDGFTGNVALKTGEGIANLISGLLRASLRRTPLSMLGALMARGALNALKKRVDPRRVNGGVFLGLSKTVIKSHGSADATGVAAAISLAHRLADQGFSEKLAARLAGALPHDTGTAPTRGEPA
ncbi:phosphate:acyl-[acyl carrier protein] acyltransferase [Loktanella atrilutea]|uniref:Phosphate acyltransferase n=1 Tax=Loktanella atrilutea TaxID=366533 RepID=A0A1M4UXN8_LOKAT|nr:phosphate acyltransferase PlsX [Loktanella atrilutea]SHE61429.1 phosphate:acyl-[acyl carrier protein] acyltransferase [Loktanella atrilutea]